MRCPRSTTGPTAERHDTYERQHGEENQRERVEGRSEPRNLTDERERDQVAGQRREVDAGASVGFRRRGSARGLEVEVLRGPMVTADPRRSPSARASRVWAD